MTIGAVALAGMATIVTAGPASAAVEDGFVVETGQAAACFSPYGAAQYVDYGPEYGDDYVGVSDICRDGVGVKVWVWINGTLIGAKHSVSGTEVYMNIPNVKKGDNVGLKVCALTSSGSAFSCGSRTEESADG